MEFNNLFIVLTCLLSVRYSLTQVIQFGSCPQVDTVRYFQLEKFLGRWYEIERYPAWYEKAGRCAYKELKQCGRRISIQHVFVRDDIEYVLHTNSTYDRGAEAVFVVAGNNVDPIGIPFLVVATDYANFAVVYGCVDNIDENLKYLSTWILSRERTLDAARMKEAYDVIRSIPGSSPVYLQTVEHDDRKCAHIWTAHVHAQNMTASEFEEITHFL
ncbi:hypothetical protein JYU34_018517 [Plutella xylostella]|uniref:Lipocalin/cytosolic fatty-acid binding domain-containing protein n=1 Tax=Plutella xylostella TaxID=51655 RepID=A0ABQ7PXR2_PLUXY|nr:hypothetical protein JYU34_018517 [Plutella xylostella]